MASDWTLSRSSVMRAWISDISLQTLIILSLCRSRHSRYDFRVAIIEFQLGTCPNCEDDVDGGIVAVTIELDLKYRFMVLDDMRNRVDAWIRLGHKNEHACYAWQDSCLYILKYWRPRLNYGCRLHIKTNLVLHGGHGIFPRLQEYVINDAS
ncbi:hypothetical protein BD769DRAFT_511932 [Suillus cothurnatus]|nr:hypothetical protein BD769DRAFT_511932 [Suillus cothurnatus]